MKTSAQGDVFEIAGGKLALQKGRSQAVKSLARRLIEDHSKSLADARKTARELHVTLESSATPSEQWELQILHTYSGAEFDHWYSTLEVKDHQQDIQETTDEVRLGSSSEVVKDARQDLPMLKMHLRLSQAAARSS